ncbi:integrase catalytic domain-containing protein [Trichonephila clavipes]|uniref:Integrase catalytic domain-containing protein n=1 Tax=Trichonephila clavipes TaxID=2585209 RepID=A0A8X6S2Y8_TRICX|nr:integrase catalytic domain-containing protein [Trichonephila clavipes]
MWLNYLFVNIGTNCQITFLWQNVSRVHGEGYEEIKHFTLNTKKQDYLNQGIIEKVKDTEINVHKPMYYLPHQAIKKEGRVTTSTRIVFDAASHQANELSLNDCLWRGPNLNPNLLDVLINFRLNRVAVSSDISQAFLQICLVDKQRFCTVFMDR